MLVPGGRRKRLLLSWLGSQGEAGREGLWVGLWLLPIQLSLAGPWSPHPRSASWAGPVPNHHPSHRERLAKGARNSHVLGLSLPLRFSPSPFSVLLLHSGASLSPSVSSLTSPGLPSFFLPGHCPIHVHMVPLNHVLI